MEARRAELQKLKTRKELRAVAKGEDIDDGVFDGVLGDAGKGWKDAGVEAILAAQFPQGAQGTLTRDAEADSHGTQPAYLSYETHRVQLVDGAKVKNEWPQHAAAHTFLQDVAVVYRRRLGAAVAHVHDEARGSPDGEGGEDGVFGEEDGGRIVLLKEQLHLALPVGRRAVVGLSQHHRVLA